MPGDVSWYWIINKFAQRTPWLHSVAAGYALWGGLVSLALLLIVAWWRARGRPQPLVAVASAVLTGVSTVVALLVNQLLSSMFARPRPCQIFPHAEVLLRCAGDYSLPSDHCVIVGAFVAGLWLVHRGYAAVATMAALVLAFARVYVGVHYPFDTVAGLLTGALIAIVIVLGLRRRATTFACVLTTTGLRPLITTAAPPDEPRVPAVPSRAPAGP